jgi:hypothetical protein
MTIRLVSLTLLALLAFVPTGLRAQNSSMSPDLMSKMLQLIASKGTDREINKYIATALGLTSGGKGWPDRQIASRLSTDPQSATHGFAVSRGSEQDVVLYKRDPDASVRLFRARRDGKLVKAGFTTYQGTQVTMRAPADAQKELETELAYWTANVDRLLAEPPK